MTLFSILMNQVWLQRVVEGWATRTIAQRWQKQSLKTIFLLGFMLKNLKSPTPTTKLGYFI